MKSETEALRKILCGMRSAYKRGENAMAFARNSLDTKDNITAATLIGYDLQAGSYVEAVKANPEASTRWCTQVGEVITAAVKEVGLTNSVSILEVGTGEATTLCGVLQNLGSRVSEAYGFDLSWSRIHCGDKWLTDNGKSASLFVGDLFNIPLHENSVDIVFSSHSLEPNGGRELDAIKECLRIARSAVVLIEPVFELAPTEARSRMSEHGYVRGLLEAANALNADVLEYKLLPYCINPLNPSGLLILRKEDSTLKTNEVWRCPLTGSSLRNIGDVFYSEEVGVGYPVIRDVPMLREEHALVLSQLAT